MENLYGCALDREMASDVNDWVGLSSAPNVLAIQLTVQYHGWRDQLAGTPVIIAGSTHRRFEASIRTWDTTVEERATLITSLVQGQRHQVQSSRVVTICGWTAAATAVLVAPRCFGCLMVAHVRRLPIQKAV